VGSGKSAVSMLRVLLMDAPERVRVDLVSRLCWRCLEETEEVRELLVGSCGVGLLPRLFPSEDEAASGKVGGRRAPIEVSDLYRGRVGGTISFADALTPAETVCDRRRTTVDGAAGDCDCVVDEGDVGKVMVASESE
jgi:hypothetical protein